MKKMVSLILQAFIWICGYAQTIDPALRQEMEQRGDDEKINVVVIMKSQYDRQQLGRRAANYVTRSERREFVVNELKQFAEASQYDLRRSLDEMERNDMTTAPKIIWMANALYFSATKQSINDLAMRRDIEIIGLDERRYVLFDEEPRPVRMTRAIATNVTQVNANQVWNLGYTGQGVVVAVIDTGVNYNHLDLADHLWDGGDAYPNHGYDFINNDYDPMDDAGHGTHCAGTVCGDGTAGTQTGMAPDATLMCVKVLDSQGYSTAAITCYGMQWAVEHGCDLFSMSLGWSEPTFAELNLFRSTCAAVLDAGVVGAISAGNNGYYVYDYLPIPYNVGTPGSCPPPYMDSIQAGNPGGLSCSICVGAVDSNDEAAGFTSRGPVTWLDTRFLDYPYTEGSNTEFGLIRPDLCAPGVNIVSADYSSDSGYITMSGTSMAAPCVAGCISLLLSKYNDATPAEICQLLEETAVSLEEGKSNTFGYGRVDALAAVNALGYGPLKLVSFIVNDTSGNDDGQLNAGESVTLDLTLLNDSNNALDGATLVLSTLSEDVTITNGTATLPHFDAGQTQTIEDVFAFTLSNHAQGNSEIWFFAEVLVNGESVGLIRFSVTVYGYTLKVDEVTVLNDNNGNGALEAGETADLHVVISNVGNKTATSIVGILSTSYPYLTLNDTIGTFGDIEIEGRASADFNVTLSSDAPDSYILDLSLDIVDGNEMHSHLDFELLHGIIVFTDSIVESLCVANWDTNGDGGLSYDEAAAVTSLGTVFSENFAITSFDELQYFTGLDSIGEMAFIYCISLTSLIIPNSVVTIGDYAFYNCTDLSGSLTIPNSVITIGERAFAYCDQLTSLTIGNSLSFVGFDAFDCWNLNAVYYMGNIPQWCNISFPNSYSNPLYFAKNLYIDNELVTDLVIPETVTEIKAFAFYGASCVTSLTLSNSVTSIGRAAFGYCSINEVYYMGNISQWCNIQFSHYESNPLYYAHNLYIDNELITDLVIPETVTEIKPHAFSGANILSVHYTGSIGQWCNITFGNESSNPIYRAHNLYINNELVTNAVIPETVTEIKAYAFYGATCITSLTLPNSVASIGENAFYSCSGLNDVYYIGDNGQWCNIIFSNGYSNPLYYAHNLYVDNELITDLVIPETVTEINDYAFYCVTFLTSLVLPSSVTSIGNYSFANCSNISSIISFAETPPEVSYYTFLNMNKDFIVYVPCGFEAAYSSLSWGEYYNFLGLCEGTVTVIADPEEGGVVTGGGTFEGGQTCTVTATPAEGYTFINWTVNGTIGSNDVEFSFIVAGDMVLVAHFVPEGNITFTDSIVKNICVSHWDANGDGELSYVEAASVTSLGEVFRGNTAITSFNELQYFIGLSSISNNAFENCSNLASFVLPSTINVLGNWAFKGCVGLTGSLTLPNSVTSIGYYAFENCSGLTGPLAIPNSVILIGGSAFYNCSGFTGSLIIGNSVTSIGGGAFSNCSGLTGSLTIPNSVTSIGEGAFSGCSGFTGTLTLPNSVTSIGYRTFYNCSGLMGTLTIPNSVTSIGEGAFSGCSGFTGDLVIPNSVVTIGSNGQYVTGAFENCTGFSGTLTLSDSLTMIGNKTFIGCSGLTGSLIIPNSVTLIGSSAFASCSGFSGDLTIPNSVTSIGGAAFSGCSGFSGDLIIPNSVTSLGGSAFYNCSGFTGTLTISNSMTTISDQAFYKCSGLTGLYIPNSVTSISYGAFWDCSGFTGSLTIPNSVTSIGSYAFYNCSGFTGSLTLPNSVTSISSNAFGNCRGLTGSLTIPNSVTSIGSYAFYNCRGFTGSLTIPNSVSSIGNYAFYQCQAIPMIISLAETPPTVGDQAFGSWSSNTFVSVPCGFEDAYVSQSWGGFSNFHGMCGGTVTVTADPEEYGMVTGSGTFEAGQTCTVTAIALEGYAFTYWTLNGVKTSYDVEYTFYVAGDMELVAHFMLDGNIVFADSNVKSICVSNWDTNADGELSYIEAASVTSLGVVFKGNTSITSFEELQYFIGLSSISGDAFRNCTGLTGSLILPNSVTSIGGYAFYNCRNLTGSLTIPNSVTTIGYDAFYNCSGFTGSLTLPNSVTYIGSEAFYNCVGFNGSLFIPNSVTNIGSYAFSYCNGFTGNLVIPNSLTSINYAAFMGCSGFSGNLTIPNSVTTIGKYAFSWCSGFTGNMTIPNSVTTINDCAFRGCSNLTSITIHNETPPTLGNDAFYNVPKAIPVYVPCGSAEAYQSAAYWSEFTSIQEVCSQQTVTLSQGWNWVSLSIEADPAMTLQMLEEALGNHAEQIKARNGQYAEYDDEEEEWFGNLAGLTCESMYMIHVANDYTIALEGTPVSSTYHEITIAPGWNWIGFPCTTEMSVADAFVDFEAEEDDELKGRGSFTTFEGEGWFGGLTTLQPGQGYMYYSNSNVVKTLIFSSGAK